MKKNRIRLSVVNDTACFIPEQPQSRSAMNHDHDKAAAAAAALCSWSTAEATLPDINMKSMVQPSSLLVTGIKSSWVPGVKWVGHRDAQNTVTEAAIAEEGIPISVSASSPSTTPTQAVACSSPEESYNSLFSELNQIKEQLMPSAKACADAINKYQSSKHSTNPGYEFRKARSYCNPYESLGTASSKNNPNKKNKKSRKRKLHLNQSPPHGLSRFVNRSAIKLANIDALLGFILTTPAKKEEETFIFVDLCGAPGGFSEYILYRSLHPAHGHENYIRKACVGFGMSLNGRNSDGEGARWDLDHLNKYHIHNDDKHKAKSGGMTPRLSYHVCNGTDGTGSIYNWDNVVHLQQDIRVKIDPSSSNNPLANLVVADGGFDAQRDSANQESIAFKIIVSQTAAALTLLRPGGMFVLKMFGFRECATRYMLNNVLHTFFDQMTFVKPILSRPASAERYLVCRGFVGTSKEWNGLAWRDKMLQVRRHECSTPPNHPLEDLMTSFDLDIAQLNIDACRSIVDYLDERRIWAERGNDVHSYEENRSCLDSNAYELEWQLNSSPSQSEYRR